MITILQKSSKYIYLFTYFTVPREGVAQPKQPGKDRLSVQAPDRVAEAVDPAEAADPV